ncbi:hypothetical protein KPH14_005855 [Odynerus spinipes]|uniref:Uncharacterized protein n=1 Tax=Odynerus spinipes TaxID=1348599 RepID=A0AAD9RBX7_9HYME|nr:hypothetical protein KPH14_005855 [Odynerus spinipes]
MTNTWGWWRWYVLCVAIVRVASYPVKESDESTGRDLESLATDDYVLADLPPVKFIGVDSGLEDFDIAPAARKNAEEKNALLSLTLEPDAEMLPANYKGVKPPGVDHMELAHVEPLSMATDSKDTRENGAEYTTVLKQATQKAKGEEGRKKAVEFEKSSKGEQEKEKKKTDYAEAAGKKKAHTIIKDNFGGHKDQAFNEKGGSYEIEDSRNKGHNAAGFHNVYHKDEYKKDADFYDNGHQGGHFRKHGRYGEKHGSLEHTFEKGSSHDSAFDQAEAKKEGEAEKSRINKEAQGRAVTQGYDGFFYNFDEFVKKAGLAKS